ncbi:MAG: type II toxin-antitoxin system PemK/MazF family toxin [Chloroflexota bacterium]|nr:MAG: type II toxin-antitoxin system PemK/MazF family toxin [Chloroflexota bacterium]
MDVVIPTRFDIFLARLDPTIGSEIRKTRPCVVISPDELNMALNTVVVAPMTTGGNAYSWRVPVTFDGRSGRVALDQIRAIDRDRLLTKLGVLDAPTTTMVLDTLAKMFAA